MIDAAMLFNLSSKEGHNCSADPFYRQKQAKENAWKVVAGKVFLVVSECEKRIRNFRTKFSKYLRDSRGDIFFLDTPTPCVAKRSVNKTEISALLQEHQDQVLLT